jgi:Zn-dependent M28 family amino/carboxypeptidase
MTGAANMGRGSARALRDLSEPAPPQVTVRDGALAEQWRGLADGTPVSATIPAPGVEKVSVKNVAGILRGSDPVLRDTYVLVTAHYDHIGARPAGEGDLINNGANDDASGTATVMELAEAFLRAGVKPKRSILFIALFGEERGLLGARFYARHPLVPVKQTIANFNFEHMGRTDDSEGPRLKKFNLTGFDFSTFSAIVKAGAARAGVEVWKHEKNSDGFFGASDNAAFADVGIPAHTASVTYMFPDYHQVGDHWDKIDYDNMRTVVQGSALALLDLANTATPPEWDKSNPRVARYAAAR